MSHAVDEQEMVLVSTKLHAPEPRPHVVARPDLIALLVDSPGVALTLIDAPAGWGKTTLLAQWRLMDPLERDFGWLSLDPGDSDPARFWSYVGEALVRIEPALDLSRFAGALRIPGVAARDLALPDLINRLAERREGAPPIVLVLDDYHLVTSREIDADLEYLLDHRPPQLQVAIAARADPALPLARMRARGDLLEVRVEELRFDEVLAAELLTEELGLDLDPSAVSRLITRTEGWAAGLYLAALSMRGRSDIEEFVTEFSGDDRLVLDYLAGEVLEGADAGLRDFLLRSSVLERMCAPLCDAVVGIEDSERILEQLERTNMFLVPLDGKRRWVRYHHLFGELLRHELERTAPDEVAALHARAGRWLAREGQHSEAVDQLIAAGEFEEAADLLTAVWVECTNRGQLSTVERWLQQLPLETIESDARLCMVAVWTALSLGRAGQAGRWLAAAEGAPVSGATWPGAPDITTEIAVGRVIHSAMVGDAGAARAVAEGLDHTQMPHDTPGRCLVGMAKGISLADDGRAAEAVEVFADAAETGIACGTHIPALVSLGYLANLAAERGDVDEADRRARQALQLAEVERHAEFPHAASAHAALARVALRRGDPDAAREHGDRATELAERSPDSKARLLVDTIVSEVRIGLGEPDQARAVASVRDRLRRGPDPGFRLTQLVRQLEEQLRTEGSRSAPAEPAGVVGARAADLTARELQVLRLLTGLMSAREIADTLYVSHNTVKTQIRSIYRKLGAGSRSEAIARGRELGVI